MPNLADQTFSLGGTSDEDIADIADIGRLIWGEQCFKIGDELVVHYSLTQAFG